MKKVMFGEVPINGEFFDMISQETFRKVNAFEAIMISGELAGKGKNDEFEADEEVSVEE